MKSVAGSSLRGSSKVAALQYVVTFVNFDAALTLGSIFQPSWVQVCSLDIFILFFSQAGDVVTGTIYPLSIRKLRNERRITTKPHCMKQLWAHNLVFDCFAMCIWFILDKKKMRWWSLTRLWALRSRALLQRLCTVSRFRSYEFGQSEECEPSHGPPQASERKLIKVQTPEEEWLWGDRRWTAEYDTVRLLQERHPLISLRTWKQLILLLLKQSLPLWNHLFVWREVHYF